MPRLRGFRLLHELLEVIDGGFHRLGGLQHFSDDQLVVVEEAADFRHPGHQRSVDDIERTHAFLKLPFEIRQQTVFRALDDIVRKPLIQR